MHTAVGIVETPSRISAAIGFPDATLGDWIVLHVKSRCEKILAEELTNQGIHFFLPFLCRPKYYGRRKVVVNDPLFPGYLFLRGSLNVAYNAANRTKRVANILRVIEQDRLDSELHNIWLALSSGARLDPYPALQKGVRVEVSSGPFRGLQGIVEDRARANRLVLQIEMLGRAVSLEVDGTFLDPL